MRYRRDPLHAEKDISLSQKDQNTESDQVKMMRQSQLLMMKKTKIETVETQLFIKGNFLTVFRVTSNCEKIYTNCYCTGSISY